MLLIIQKIVTWLTVECSFYSQRKMILKKPDKKRNNSDEPILSRGGGLKKNEEKKKIKAAANFPIKKILGVYFLYAFLTVVFKKVQGVVQRWIIFCCFTSRFYQKVCQDGAGGLLWFDSQSRAHNYRRRRHKLAQTFWTPSAQLKQVLHSS